MKADGFDYSDFGMINTDKVPLFSPRVQLRVSLLPGKKHLPQKQVLRSGRYMVRGADRLRMEQKKTAQNVWKRWSYP